MFEGYPGAYTVSSGKDSHGKTIALQPVSLKKVYDIGHGASDMFAACDGTGTLPGTDGRNGRLHKEGSIVSHRIMWAGIRSRKAPDRAHGAPVVLADDMFQLQLTNSSTSTSSRAGLIEATTMSEGLGVTRVVSSIQLMLSLFINCRGSFQLLCLSPMKVWRIKYTRVISVVAFIGTGEQQKL